jgi:hypothetical protein
LHSGSPRLQPADVGDDVADEPNVPEALLSMDNVVLLPHVGSGTVQTRAAMEALTLSNLDSFLASGEMVTPVPLPPARDRVYGLRTRFPEFPYIAHTFDVASAQSVE